jgi:hypothetical protein
MVNHLRKRGGERERERGGAERTTEVKEGSEG